MRIAAVISTFALVTAPLAARAQEAPREDVLTVVGLDAPDGDVGVASRLSTTLRAVAREDHRSVPDDTPTLAQEFAMVGCSTTDAECLAQIASDLHARQMLYGSVERTSREADTPLRVELGLWSSGSDRGPLMFTEALTARASDDELRSLARRLYAQLARPRDATVATPAPVARVIVPVERTAPSSRPRGHTLRLAGLGLVGVGVIAGAIGVWQWARTSDLADQTGNGDGEYGAAWRVYENAIAPPVNGARPLTVDAVCARSERDASSDSNAARVRDLCSAHSTALGLAWGLGMGGVALAAAGAALLVLDGRASSREAAARVTVAPMLSATARGASVGVAF